MAKSSESAGGAFPFRPLQRARSESSFTERRDEPLGRAAAGVTSTRFHRHFSKGCQNTEIQRDTDPMMLTMDDGLYTTAHFRTSGDCHSPLDGRRVDPASAVVAAGVPRHMQGLSKCSEEPPDKKSDKSSRDKGGRSRKQTSQSPERYAEEPKTNQRMTIEMVPHKKILSAPRRDPIRHEGDKPDPYKPGRRNGYKAKATQMSFTFNECGETGFSPKIAVVRSSTPSGKLHTSCKGEKKYNICGVEDMREAATSHFVKSDVPPSATLLDHNNRTELVGFEFRAVTPRVIPMHNSSAMWGCLNWASRREWEPPEMAFMTPGRASYKSDQSSYAGPSSPADYISAGRRSPPAYGSDWGGSMNSQTPQSWSHPDAAPRPCLQRSSSVPSRSIDEQSSASRSRASSVSGSRASTKGTGNPAANRCGSRSSASPARSEFISVPARGRLYS